MPKKNYNPSLRGTLYLMIGEINQKIHPMNIYFEEYTSNKEDGPRMDIYLVKHEDQAREQLIGNATDERICTFLLGMKTTFNLLKL